VKPPTKTALFDAAKRWDAAAVAAILAAAPGLLTATDPRGRLALHLACAVKPGASGLAERDGTETAAALLGDEGDFRATPVWYAAARGENLVLVRFLLARGADASPCLWAAVWRDDPVMLGALLAAKPRLNLIAHGETPLFSAARLKRLKTLDLLIEAGADPSIPDRQGRDAVAIARARRLSKEVVARLEKARGAA
jgi:uncharacterized protein